MRIIIVEDEKPAAEKLQKSLREIDARSDVQAVLRSNDSAIKWLLENEMPELIFMDIELSDGLSFKIFDEVSISCPVIFTTAYDEYWQQAFEHNSIDYLLKPVKQEKLEASLKKYNTLKTHFATTFQNFIVNAFPGNFKAYKKRFLVKKGAEYISLKTEEIAYFYATHKLVCLVDQKNRKYILDLSLSDIEKQVDPEKFYRVNRKYLVNMSAVKKVRMHPKSKLMLELEPTVNEVIVVSQDNAAAFKNWIGG